MQNENPIRSVGPWALPLLPGVLILWLSFRGGGFFAGAAATLGVVLLLAMVLRITLLEAPFQGATRSLSLASGALVLLAIWACSHPGGPTRLRGRSCSLT